MAVHALEIDQVPTPVHELATVETPTGPVRLLVHFQDDDFVIGDRVYRDGLVGERLWLIYADGWRRLDKFRDTVAAARLLARVTNQVFRREVRIDGDHLFVS